MIYDVAIVGAGPAGSTCAALCAAGGLSTLLLERAVFPRDKVCGDCLNPAAWPVLERLGVADAVLEQAHSRLERVEFIGLDQLVIGFQLSVGPGSEIAIKRRLLDQLLLERAMENGAQVLQNTAVTSLDRGWQIQTPQGPFSARHLIAADGRNSTVARMLSLFPAMQKDRVALQAHIAAPADFGEKVVLQFVREGYCGLASIGDALVNLCLVSRPGDLGSIRTWAETEFGIARNHRWNTITPLSRASVPPAHERLLLIGDAARVVEPFTGEGIYYALATGALAADFLTTGRPLEEFADAQRRLYRGRLWVNQLAKQACLHPRLATTALRALRFRPELLRLLTAKVTGEATLEAAPAGAAKR
jgi:geranylgeranyl reductase family protein